MSKNQIRVLQEKQRRRPVFYPEFAEAHFAICHSPWTWQEVAMSSDIKDWSEISEKERKVFGGILKGFTLQETGVGCFWRDIVAKKFNHPEIVDFATSASHQETIHGKAYDHLEATLGLDTYDAFKSDPVASKKINDILEQTKNPPDLATSLAIFSGAVEGVSLFSSFAILLSFLKISRFKGIGQILSWSVLDEANHSKMGIRLYHILTTEAPHLKPSYDKVKEGFERIVDNELAFIEQAFTEGDLETIKKAEAIDYTKYRANLKIMELGFKPIYELTGEYKTVKQTFDSQITTQSKNDFFAVNKNGSGYSAKLLQSFEGCDYTYDYKTRIKNLSNVPRNKTRVKALA